MHFTSPPDEKCGLTGRSTSDKTFVSTGRLRCVPVSDPARFDALAEAAAIPHFVRHALIEAGSAHTVRQRGQAACSAFSLHPRTPPGYSIISVSMKW